MTQRFIQASEVAKICRVTHRTVLGWANRGVIPGAHKLGGVWRFDERKLKSWIASCERKPTVRSSVSMKSDRRLEKLLGIE